VNPGIDSAKCREIQIVGDKFTNFMALKIVSLFTWSWVTHMGCVFATIEAN
jgi:hypothetical protein